MARVVKPRLQIYDIELEVRRALEAGLIKFDDRELCNENERGWDQLVDEGGYCEEGESAACEIFSDATSPVICDISSDVTRAFGFLHLRVTVRVGHCEQWGVFYLLVSPRLAPRESVVVCFGRMAVVVLEVRFDADVLSMNAFLSDRSGFVDRELVKIAALCFCFYVCVIRTFLKN